MTGRKARRLALRVRRSDVFFTALAPFGALWWSHQAGARRLCAPPARRFRDEVGKWMGAPSKKDGLSGHAPRREAGPFAGELQGESFTRRALVGVPKTRCISTVPYGIASLDGAGAGSRTKWKIFRVLPAGRAGQF